MAAVIARFFTSNVFSETQAETMGWKYGSMLKSMLGSVERKGYVDLHPDIKVISENRDQSRPPSGKVMSAASSGKIQNSPKIQCRVRSLKNSLLYAEPSIVMTCKAAEGIVSMFESNLENPIRFSVSVKYACTGVAGMYPTRPTKYRPHMDGSDHVFEGRRLFKSRETFSEVISENPVNHNDFLAFRIPRLAEDYPLGLSRWRYMKLCDL